MGAGVSTIVGPDGEASYAYSGLGDMPESCVAAVLLYLDAPEICSVARLNRAFRGAASADFVWEVKLPTNYEYLMALIDSGDEGQGEKRACLKKEIYAMLCRRNPFDGGRKVLLWRKMEYDVFQKVLLERYAQFLIQLFFLNRSSG